MRKNVTGYQVADMVTMLMSMEASELRLAGYEHLLGPQMTPQQMVELKALSPKVMNKAVTVRPYVMWAKFREVYNVHPHVSNALLRMKSDAKIPAGILRNLRHPNPLIVLDGEGIPVTHPDGKAGDVRAMYVTGAVSMAYPQTNGAKIQISGLHPQDARASHILDTVDAVANAYRVTVVSDVWGSDGTPDSTDLVHLTVPLTKEFTVDELLDAVQASGFAWNVPTGGLPKEQVEKNRAAYLADLARIVVSHLLYVTSRTAEISKPKDHRAPFKKQNSWDRAPKASKMHQVGYQTGAAIADWKKSELRTASESSGSGHAKMPHIRAPHLHLYRVGPGRSEIEIKFLDAIKVNFDQYDGKTSTMHDVR